MNLLLFTHHLNQGGAEKTVRILSEYYNTNDLGVQCYICVVYDDPELEPYPQNVIVMEHCSDPEDSRLSKGMNVLAQIREMREIKRRCGIDVCVSFLPGADIINVFSGVGERQIVSVRNKESLFVHNILKKWYVQIAYRRCDHIVACSETVRQDCIDYFHVPEGKITTIHNAAVPAASTSEVIPEFAAFCGQHMVYLNVGRLAPEKGQEHLLRAFADFAQKCHNEDSVSEQPGLVFVGDGPLRERLESLAGALGIAGQVLFCGRQENPADYMQRADVFVLSSNSEGMPNVLVEALQCGLPCIATECGAREILAPETDAILDVTDQVELAAYGILVPVCHSAREESMLADAMARLYTDDELREHYVHVSANAVAGLSLDRIARRWLEVIGHDA